MNSLLIAATLAAAPAPAPSLEQTLEICRVTLIEDEARGRKMFAAVPERDKPLVALICLVYRRGGQDVLDSLEAPDVEASLWNR